MKKVIALFAFLSMTMLVSCSGNGPEGVAKKFIELTTHGEFGEAKKYCDEKTGQLLGMAESMIPADKKAEAKKQKVNVEIISSEIKDDTAKVKYIATVEGEKADAAKSGEKTLDLVKVDGKWKVTIDKENGNKEGAGQGAAPGGVTPADTMAPEAAPVVPADSLQ